MFAFTSPIWFVGHALSRALPYPGLFQLLGSSVAQLIEMIADDAAVRRHGRHTVARALLALGATTVPAGALGVAGPSGLSRALRLSADPLPRRARLARAGLSTAVAVLVLGPYLTAFAPLPYFC